MKKYELLPQGGTQNDSDARPLVWGRSGSETDTVRTDVDPWLRSLGSVSATAIDLVRIAAATYMADRLSARGAGFSRTIGLHVQMIDPSSWAASADSVADLLHWLTADSWELEFSGDVLDPLSSTHEDGQSHSVVSLMSGGLDSLCGAFLHRRDSDRLLIGHWDSPIVRGSQKRVGQWLREDAGAESAYVSAYLSHKQEKKESSMRSRSFLFLSLAVAAATGCAAGTVEVPENGFTSLNPPLGPNRGGALSTRSTHPWTIHLFNELLAEVGLSTRVENPYEQMTKGDLVRAAAAEGADLFAQGAAITLSCAKMDGARYKGGDANLNCGLCMPCLVRRGSFIAAGVVDKTEYLIDHLKASARDELIQRRGKEVAAVKTALAHGIDDVDLLSQGPFPDSFDIETGLETCTRGLAELAAVSLP